MTEKLFIKWRKCEIFESSKSRLEWNLKFIPKVDLIKWSSISSHSWNFWSYNCLTHGHSRLAIYKFTSTFLRSPFSKELHKGSCLVLGVKLLQMKTFCFLCISSINCFENEVINGRYTILDVWPFHDGGRYHIETSPWKG